MLSNHIIGSHKFVLFIDDVGNERNGVKIMENLLAANNVIFTDKISEIYEKSSVLMSPLSKLSLTYRDEEIFRLIQSLKRNENVNQIFCWATSKNINSSILIPFLDHMSDVTVTIKSPSHLTILTKKKFGNVKLKEYHHELQLGKTSLKEVTVKSMPKEVTKAEDPEIIGTFKIGQFKNDELEAKKNMKLPFEIM